MITLRRIRRRRLAVMPLLLFAVVLRALVPDVHALTRTGLEGASALCSQVEQNTLDGSRLPARRDSAPHCELCVNPFVAGPPAELRVDAGPAFATSRTAAPSIAAPTAALLRTQTARGPPRLS